MTYSVKTLQWYSSSREFPHVKSNCRARAHKINTSTWERQRSIPRPKRTNTLVQLHHLPSARFKLQATHIKVHLICFLRSLLPFKESYKSYDFNVFTSTSTQLSIDFYAHVWSRFQYLTLYRYLHYWEVIHCIWLENVNFYYVQIAPSKLTTIRSIISSTHQLHRNL